MSRLSKFVKWSPKIFYVAAIVVFVLSIALPLHELNRFGYSVDLPRDQVRVAIVQLVLREGTNALFLLANGLLLEVLIAIWEKLGPAKNDEAAE